MTSIKVVIIQDDYQRGKGKDYSPYRYTTRILEPDGRLIAEHDQYLIQETGSVLNDCLQMMDVGFEDKEYKELGKRLKALINEL